jgi:ABC-type glycerol-3-phosphate transport system substrate-binding protein
VATPFIQAQGTGEGAFFDQETLAALIDNAGFRRAMEIYKATTDFGPPDELNLDVGDTRGLFTSGRCALSMDWGRHRHAGAGHVRGGQDRCRHHAGHHGGARSRQRRAGPLR